MAMDPIHQNEFGNWYFYDEIWVDRIGPFKDESTARAALKDYFEYLNTGKVAGDSALHQIGKGTVKEQEKKVWSVLNAREK